MRIPHYLVKNHNGIYYFRYVIPQSKLHLFPNNKREYRRSLKTRCRKEAIKRAKYFWVAMMTSPPSNNENDYEVEMNRELEMLRVGSSIQDQIDVYQKEYEATYCSDSMDLYIGSLNSYQKDCLNLHAERAFKSTHSHSPVHVATPSVTNTTTVPRKRIDELMATYLNDKKAFIEKKTYDGYKQQFALFLRIINVTYTDEITTEIIQLYKEILPKLPPRINLNQNTKNKSINEILQLGLDRIASRTLHKNLVSVSGLLKWLHQQTAVEQDFSTILHGIRNISKKKKSKNTDVFSLDDLEAMFTTDEYQHNCFKGYAFRYWLPLLALYTGARSNELCQLFVNDIYKDEGIYVLRLEDMDEEKKVKNDQSNRIVPIHKKLIELGFLDYVELMRTQNHKQVFPSLKPDKYGYRTKNISRFFNSQYKSHNGFLDRCGIHGSYSKGRKVFYSFRHTFINNAKQREMNLFMIKQITGHASDDMTMDTYGKDYGITLLKKNIDEMKFDVKHPKKWHKRFL